VDCESEEKIRELRGCVADAERVKQYF